MRRAPVIKRRAAIARSSRPRTAAARSRGGTAATIASTRAAIEHAGLLHARDPGGRDPQLDLAAPPRALDELQALESIDRLGHGRWPDAEVLREGTGGRPVPARRGERAATSRDPTGYDRDAASRARRGRRGRAGDRRAGSVERDRHGQFVSPNTACAPYSRSEAQPLVSTISPSRGFERLRARSPRRRARSAC